jgi:hypothetical protein
VLEQRLGVELNGEVGRSKHWSPVIAKAQPIGPRSLRS